MAAKAVGLRPLCFEKKRCGLQLGSRRPPGFPTRWNPLLDDGDALRLAARCDIDIIHFSDFARADYMVGVGYFSEHEAFGDDKMAAIRRAIVRAAAEIGRSMP